MAQSEMKLAIDAHVHLHEPADALAVIEAAGRRFAALHPDRIGVVMLAERAGYDVFDILREALVPTGDPEALWLDERRRLLVLAGRQVVSAEGLEILALATVEKSPDGLSADETIARLDAGDALVVLPWGVGKWLGQRGRIVDRMMAAAHPDRLFLGDNGGRPAAWRAPRFASKLKVLSGSDPLPLAGSQSAIGGFGSLTQIALSPEHPATSLKRGLRDPATRLQSYGANASLLKFVVDQTRLRLPVSGARA